MSVYLPRSAVRPTISPRRVCAAISAWPKGASTVGRGIRRLVDAHGLGVGARARHVGWPSSSSIEGVPFVGIDADEMCLLPLLERRHALAGQRAQHDRMRPAVAARGRTRAQPRPPPCRCRRSRRTVPAEGAPFVGDRLDVDDDRAVGLDAVAVDQRDEIVEAEGRARDGRLPGGAFLQLAVRQLAEDARVRACEAEAERHADPLPEPMAERTADDLDARRGVERRHLQPAVVGAVGRRARRAEARPPRRAPPRARPSSGRSTAGSGRGPDGRYRPATSAARGSRCAASTSAMPRPWPM